MVRLLPFAANTVLAAPRLTRRFISMRRPEVGILALAMLSACAIPTEAPNWDMQWNLPINSTELDIDLTDITLPAGIQIDSTLIAGSSPAAYTRTAFTAVVQSVPAITRTLGAQCPTCPSGTAPKPAFTAPVSSTTVSLTSGSTLVSATLAAGSQIVVVLNNGFGFDPINPPGGTPGNITVAVNNGAATLGTLTLVGPTNAIPAGQSRTFTIPLVGTINATQPITVTMTMDSPAGSPTQPVAMSPTQTFTVSSTPTIKVSTATVNMASAPIDPTTTEMDLSDMDDIGQRVENSTTTQGAMILTVTNPFAITTNATMVFAGTRQLEGCEGSGCTVPMTPITKPLNLPAGGTATPATVTINFTGAELRELLGANMISTLSGSTGAGTLTNVVPTSKVTIAARMRIRFFVREPAA